MDFFSILQNNSNENDNLLKSNTNIKKNKKNNANIKDSNINNSNINDSNINDSNINNEIDHNNSYKNIRKGNFVKIIGIKDSFLNHYKGYIGEIKDYKKDQDFALVFLHCINNVSIIKFPIYHFIIID
jgi:hypothetical protein